MPDISVPVTARARLLATGARAGASAAWTIDFVAASGAVAGLLVVAVAVLLHAAGVGLESVAGAAIVVHGGGIMRKRWAPVRQQPDPLAGLGPRDRVRYQPEDTLDSLAPA